ncbi:hypothetical protein CJ030_MR4G016267 [Morella rubra]|uniref:Leucine-rich repeat-containing N-terminal plant-type domain-containing protein n=1 Tax=Morella rubra TaxID=262757 RepID=A0A6A1VQ92_9ROSI|nr:hypothetical protein CJ030_MR4G016267 [Morella rubra]
MASAMYFCIVVVAWATCILLCGTYLNTAFEFVEASHSPALQLEAKALQETGWWPSEDSDNTSSPCEWGYYGSITCNALGSVTEIDRTGFDLGVSLHLRRNGLQGSIPPQIGMLSKLHHLDLSYNNLTAQLPPSLANLSQLMISFDNLLINTNQRDKYIFFTLELNFTGSYTLHLAISSKLAANLKARCNVLDLPEFMGEMSPNSKFGMQCAGLQSSRVKNVFIP